MVSAERSGVWPAAERPRVWSRIVTRALPWPHSVSIARCAAGETRRAELHGGGREHVLVVQAALLGPIGRRLSEDGLSHHLVEAVWLLE